MARNTIDLRNRKPTRPSLPFTTPSKRRSPLRTRRRKARAFIALATLIGLAALGYGISWLSYIPQLSIQQISITGTKEVPMPLVQRYVESVLDDGSYRFFSGRNIFLYPKHKIEEGVPAFFPRIHTASVSRESLFATAITVVVEERESYAKWCRSGERSGECFLMDEGGFVFADATSSVAALAPQIYRGDIVVEESPIGKTYLPGHLAGIENFVRRLGQTGFQPTEIIADSPQDFSVSLATGLVLRASFGADVEALVNDLQLILNSPALRGKESELEYIDLRFGNRVYYKLKGEEQQSTE